MSLALAKPLIFMFCRSCSAMMLTFPFVTVDNDKADSSGLITLGDKAGILILPSAPQIQLTPVGVTNEQ